MTVTQAAGTVEEFTSSRVDLEYGDVSDADNLVIVLMYDSLIGQNSLCMILLTHFIVKDGYQDSRLF